MKSKETIQDRMYGCLYGHAIGNALGITTEFKTKEEVHNQYPNQLSTYPYGYGEWEDDDTKQMLCVLNELKANKTIVPKSLAQRLKTWLEIDGRGCGNLIYHVIQHQEFLEHPFKASYDRWILSNKEAAPNGGIMRTSVIGLMPDKVELNAENACKVTHYDSRCVGSCVIASKIIHTLIWLQRELTYDEVKSIALKYDRRINKWIDLAHNGSLSDLDLGSGFGMGYTLKTLAAALWAYWHADDFRSGLIAIVNEGGDADTNAAIGCAILGAKFGYVGVPTYYIENLHNRQAYHDKIKDFIEQIIN